MTLRQSSFEELESGISLDRLPKTFRDAVYVVRRLGIKYLWIDSLCIFQDSKDDWRKESAVMGHIYRNGTLNIAATAASGGDQGLDFPRDNFLSKPLRVEVRWNAEIAPGFYYIVENSFWTRSVDHGPLNKRAWVLQERLSSPRILHFTADQLLWQCGLDSLCEMFPAAPSDYRLGVGPTGFTDRDLRAFTTVLQSIEETPQDQLDLFVLEEAYRPWDTLVSTYSAMNLTQGEDKLIAIQALADAMQTAVRDRYIAGLWKSRIVEDLLWRLNTVTSRGTTSRPARWRAPSWSWASLDGPVQKATLPGRYAGRKQFDGVSMVHGIEAFVEGYLERTTGQLKSARLEICGCLYKTQIPLQGRWAPRHQKESGSYVVVDTGCEILPMMDIWPDECDLNVDPGSECRLPEVMYLFLVGTYSLTSKEPGNNCFEGLLLTPDAAVATFRRFAYFSVTGAEGGLDAAFEKPVEMERYRESVESLGRQFYNFTLV